VGAKKPTMKPIATNTLFYGDNLPILREYLPDESVDQIYLDPPFSSQRSAL
jgi:site-specific DNA-methyltransferase (adenine-specific)